MRNQKGQFIKGIIPWNKGLKGIKNPHNEEWNKKIGLANKNRKRTKEEKDRLKKIGFKIGIKSWNKGIKTGIAPWKGKVRSDKDKLKMSESAKKNPVRYWLNKKRLDMLGNKNPNWRNGKSFENYGFDWVDDLKESIRKRDNYICQECGVHQDELDRRLDVHHIDYNKKNCNPENLISLCRICHLKTNYNRDNWINHFK